MYLHHFTRKVCERKHPKTGKKGDQGDEKALIIRLQ